MINTSHSAPQRYSAASQQPQAEQEKAPEQPTDRFDLSGIPTAVKLYDMSPLWGPKQEPFVMPRGVRGLC